jgi:hypothetical protein
MGGQWHRTNFRIHVFVQKGGMRIMNKVGGFFVHK